MIELRDVNILNGLLFVKLLKLNKGVYYIKGESGSGKTSLLKCIGGELQCDGRVVVRGSVCCYFHDCVLNYNCSLNDIVNMDDLINKRTYYELLIALDMVGLENKKCIRLSKGEKQRAELLLVLSCDSDVYLLDEPCSSLNYKYRRFIYSWIKKQSINKLFVVSTHDKVDDYLCIEDGKLTPYYDDANVMEVGYETYNKCNFKIVKKLWFNVPKTIINIINVSLTLMCLYIAFNINEFFSKDTLVVYVLAKLKVPINNLKFLSVVFTVMAIVMYMMYFVLDLHLHDKCIQNFKRRFSSSVVNRYIGVRFMIELIVVMIVFMLGIVIMKMKFSSSFL